MDRDRRAETIMRKRDIEESGLITALILLCDIGILVASVWAARILLQTCGDGLLQDASPVPMLTTAVLCYLPAVLLFPPILQRRFVRVEHIPERVFRLSLTHILLYTAVLFAVEDTDTPRAFFPVYFLLLTPLLSWERLLWHHMMRYARSKGYAQRHIVLVGEAEAFQELCGLLRDKRYGCNVEGLFSDRPDEPQPAVPLLGAVAEVKTFIDEHPYITDLYAGTDSLTPAQVLDLYGCCEEHGIRFCALPASLGLLRHDVLPTPVEHILLLSTRPGPLQIRANRLLKRGLDIGVSTLVLLTLFPPVYVAMALLIKYAAPGPVFIKRRYNGRNGRTFNGFRFRCTPMDNKNENKTDAENGTCKFTLGTWLQRTYIDQWPLFINVFRGDMSLVGPRPQLSQPAEPVPQPLDSHLPLYEVKPGLTGYARVKRGTSPEQVQTKEDTPADIWYAEHWTLWLDLHILWLTWVHMLRRKRQHTD